MFNVPVSIFNANHKNQLNNAILNNFQPIMMSQLPFLDNVNITYTADCPMLPTISIKDCMDWTQASVTNTTF